jgi:hypothetical protein
MQLDGYMLKGIVMDNSGTALLVLWQEGYEELLVNVHASEAMPLFDHFGEKMIVTFDETAAEPLLTATVTPKRGLEG